jgi:uncharacterized protein
MTPEQIAEVWRTLDRDVLARIAHRGPRPVFATISGAHLYGFASPDSDVDLRGAFLLSVRDLLGLQPARETVEVADTSGLDLDWVAHDVRKFARLMTRHNGYVLEQLYSPLVVVTNPAHEELMELGRGCITRPTVRHYQGFARGRRERLAQPGATVKHLLYTYRVLLAGIQLMRAGEVVSHIEALNARFGVSAIDELVARKREGAERGELAPGEAEAHASELDALELALSEAHAASGLPEEPTTTAALDAFVVRLRLGADESP